MDKNSFKSMLGILGSYLITDRIFQAIDADNDGLVSLEDYLVYNDVISYGTEEERSQQTFIKIDLGKRGLVNFSEFKDFFYTYLELQTMVDASATNMMYSDEYLQFTFNQIAKGAPEFDFNMFQDAKEENPKLFEFLE